MPTVRAAEVSNSKPLHLSTSKPVLTEASETRGYRDGWRAMCGSVLWRRALGQEVDGAPPPPTPNNGMPRRGAPLRGAPCRRRLGHVTVRERRRACLRSAIAALRHAGDAQNVICH